jgi:sugar phosphate permease
VPSPASRDFIIRGNHEPGSRGGRAGGRDSSGQASQPARASALASLIGTTTFAGIFGASLAPYIATWLATNYGLQFVGYYLSLAAILTLIGLLRMGETKDHDLAE